MQQLFERIYQQKDLSQTEMEQLATAMFDQEVTAKPDQRCVDRIEGKRGKYRRIDRLGSCDAKAGDSNGKSTNWGNG